MLCIIFPAQNIKYSVKDDVGLIVLDTPGKVSGRRIFITGHVVRWLLLQWQLKNTKVLLIFQVAGFVCCISGKHYKPRNAE